MTTTEKRAAIVAAARALIKVPYRHQGRSVHGHDCSGLIIVSVWQALKKKIEDYLDYSPFANTSVMMEHLGKNCRRITGGQVRLSSIPLAAILYFCAPKNRMSHFGIKSGPETMIHSWRSCGFTSESSIDPRWQRLLHSAWDLNVVVEAEAEAEI